MNSIEKVVELLKKNHQEKDGNNSTREQITHNSESRLGSISKSKESLEINLECLREKGYISPDTLDSIKAEEFRIIKRPLLQNAFGKGAVPIINGNMIMVTSSLPDEGKTYISLSLAMSIALERDKTVLLVDCDLINPSLSRLLEINDKIGLTDYLHDPKTSLEDIIINTSIPRLRVIPSGNAHLQANELLTSVKMADLTKELSERYSDRIILFDAAPLLLANQAVVVSQLAGQVILVIEAEKTPINITQDAVALLDDEKVIGVVLNKARKLSGRNYYGTYYDRSNK